MDSQRAKEGVGTQGAELGADPGKQEQGNGSGEIQLLRIPKVHAYVSDFTQGTDTYPEEELLHKVHLRL